MFNNIQTGQAIVKHETPHDSSVSISNIKVRMEINYRLGNELNDVILTPVVGVQKVRKVLNRYGLDIPALYELDHEGDEIVLEMDQFGKVRDFYDMPQFDSEEDDETYYLYLIYYLTDEGTYDFYAEVTDDEGIEEIMALQAEDEQEELKTEKNV